MMARSALKRPAFAVALLAMLLVYLAVLVSNKRILIAAHIKRSAPPAMLDQQEDGVPEGDEKVSSILGTSAGKVGGAGAGGEGEGDRVGGAWPSSWGDYVAVNPGATLPNLGRTQGGRGGQRKQDSKAGLKTELSKYAIPVGRAAGSSFGGVFIR